MCLVGFLRFFFYFVDWLEWLGATTKLCYFNAKRLDQTPTEQPFAHILCHPAAILAISILNQRHVKSETCSGKNLVSRVHLSCSPLEIPPTVRNAV